MVLVFSIKRDTDKGTSVLLGGDISCCNTEDKLEFPFRSVSKDKLSFGYADSRLLQIFALLN